MDTGKLLKIIDDIQSEERNNKVQSSLTNIVSYYGQNTAVSIESLDVEKQNVLTAVTGSTLSQYALSDYSALERIKVADLFGPGLYQRLDNILHAQAHEVANLLQQLVAERDAALSSLNALKSNLVKFHFESRELDDHNYEIGFSLPESYADLSKTESAIKDFRLFLEALASATGNQQPLRIKYVSNGSIELFLQASVDLVQNFGVALEYALNIYGAIKVIEEMKKGFNNFSANRKKSAKKLANDEKKEKINKLIDEMIIKLGLIEEDDKNRVKGLFQKFLKHIESGVSAEVHTPKIEAPTEPVESATNEEKDEYKNALNQYKKKIEIDMRNREVFILQQNNFYGMDTKFLEVLEVTTNDNPETEVQ